MSMNNKFFGVGIGASAGGQKALCEFFAALPSDTGAAYFVATHLLRDFKSELDAILQRYTDMPVIRVTETMPIRPDTVYVLVENTMMFIIDDELNIRARSESEMINKAANIFLSSLAGSFKEKAVAIILSGSGDDGVEGIREINKYRGTVLVQSPQSSQHSGMPFAAIQSDHPTAIKKPSGLAKALMIIVDGRAAEIHKPDPSDVAETQPE